MGAACAVEDSALNNTVSATQGGGEMLVPIVESADNDVLSATHDISGSTFSEIQNYLNTHSIAEGDTIYLGNQTWNSGSWTPWDSNVISVNIANLIISGGTNDNPNNFATMTGNSKIFEFNAPGITLKNIKFTNVGDNNSPGSSVNIKSSDCTIENCIFDSCYNNNGGAIHASGDASNTIIDNCNFTNCNSIWSTPGGAIYYEGADLSISNSNFKSIGGSNTVTIVNKGKTKIDNCNFTDNQIGSIYSGSDIEIKNTNFINNGAGSYNNKNIGAVYSEGTTTVENSIFEDNLAQNNGYGGIYSVGATKVADSNFTENTGGAIYSGSNAEIINCIIADNSGSNSAVNIYGTAIVDNCNFTGNSRTNNDHGGALTVNGANSKVTNSNFDNNHAGYGGAIYNTGENFMVDNCNFTNNALTVNYGYGGAIQTVGVNSSVKNSKFKKNNGASSGGAIQAEGSDFSVINCEFEENQATNGGAINIAHDNAKISECNFTDNSATTNGGAIYIAEDCYDENMEYCKFEGNTATTGTAIFCGQGGNGKVTNCSLGGVTDLNVLGGYPELTFTLSTDYSNIVVGNIEGASSEGSKVPIVGEEIKLDIYDLNGNPIKTVTLNETDDKGQTRYDYSDLPLAKYRYTATYLDGKTKEGTFGVNVVEGDNFSSIREAINNAEPGEVLILKDKTYLNDIDGSMVIDKSIAIVGNGAVLDAEGKSRIFTINENIKGVNLENITFINGNSADNGGAIYIGNNADGGRIANSTFRDNTAQVGGGAIKNQRAYDWIVDDCVFIHNIAESTFEQDTSKVPNGGGAVWSCESLTRIYNSTFIDNEAGYGGAVRGFVNTYNSEFYFNVAFDGNGGGIDVTIDLDGIQWPTLEFINTTFVNNTAKGIRSQERAQGGALHTYHIDHVDIIDCKIYNNTADRGGAVDLFIINSVFVDNCDIENNTAHSEGGGFYINASSELNRTNEFRNTNITKNHAGTEGGALYLITNNALFDNIIANNNSAARGGAAFVRGDNATVQYSTFNYNEAFRNESDISGRGGALNIWGKNCQLINVTADNNTADRGGSAFIRGDDTYVVNSFFNGNTAHIRGGGLNVGNGTNIRIINVTVSDNWANTTGGGIFVLADGTTFFNVTADNNTAQNGGGAYIEGNHVRIELGEFNNNTALYNGTYDTGLGGALDVKGNGCTIVNLTSNDNKGYRGGSTFIRGSDTTVINCTMDNNNATFRGGALNIGGGDNARIINVSVSNNRAKDEAGAVYVVGSHSLFDNFTAINNTANAGGGFEIEGDDTTIQNSTIRNNTALNGGGMYITGDDVFLFNNSITFNRALDPTDEAYCNGGGVAIEASSYDSLVNFTNNNISSNYAQDNGGGVFIFVMSGEVYMDNVTAYNNTAENGGFCHVMCCENLVVKNSTFDSNRAIGDIFGYPDRGEGGAFHISNELNFLIDSHADIQGNFYNNTAMNGSSIYIQDASLKVYNSTFYDNQAHSYYLPIVPLNNTKFNQTDDITISVRLQGGDNIANAIHNKDGACEVLVYNITYPFYTIDGKVIDKQTPSRYMAPVVGPNAEDIYLYDFENNQVITLILYTGAGNFTYNEETGEYVYNGNGSEVNRFDYIVQPIFEANSVDDKIIVNRAGKSTVFTYDSDSGMYINNKSGVITSLQVSPKGDSMEYTFNKSGAITKVYYNSTSDEYVFNESGIITKVKYNETTGIYTFNRSGKVSNYYSINKTNINGTVNVPLTQLKGILDPGKYTVLALYRESTYYTEIYNYTTFIVKGLVEKLTVNKTVGLGDNVDFVVTVTNQYNFTLHNVTITEIFKTSELKYLDYTNKGNWTIGNITTYNVTISKNNVVNYTSIVFKYKGNLSANQSTNFTITFKTLKLGTLVNTVNLTTNETKDFILTAKNETLVINLVEKLTVNETVVLGDNVDFVVVVSNRENMTLHNVTITEIFRTSELQYVNYTNQSNWTIGKITTYNVNLPGEGLVNFTSIVFTYKGNLSAYNNTNFTITFKTLKTGTLVNTVNLTTNETGSKIFNATNTTLVYKLLEKLTVNETVRVGENVSFIVVVNNLENRTLHNVTITEIFRTSELQYVNYTNQGNWTIGKITTYNVTLPGEGLVNFTSIVFTYKGNLSANQSTNFTITFNAKVNGTLVNTVNLTTNETGNKIFNATNTTTVINNIIANLTVTKLALNTTVVVGDRVYFMVVVNNTGDFALGNVTVYEIYDSGKLTLVDYNNHDLWERNGNVFTYKGVLDVNKTANFTVWFTTNVNGTVVNTVNASSNLTGNKTAKNDTLVISPNMTVTKLALNDTVVIGDNVYFMVVVNNTGDCALGNVTVSEIYDSGKLTLVDYKDHDLWDVNGDVFTYKGVLARGESANFTVWFTTNVNGTVVNTVNASSNLTGNKTAKNDTLVISPNMTVSKLALNDTVVIGDNVYFMIVVNNAGDCALGNVTVSEIYDSGKLTLVDYDNHVLWDVNGDVFTYKGVLGVNESANFTVWFTTMVNGTVVNTVNASSNLTGNKTASNDTLVISPNMTVTKLALNDTVVIGDNVYFMVVVNNTGDCALADVVVTEIYDSGKLTLVDFDDHDLWELKGDVFTYKGVLGVNKSANFTVWFTTMVNGTVVNTVNASSNLTENKTTSNKTLVINPNMTVQKLTVNKIVYVNDRVIFTVVVTNTGDCDLGNITVRDEFPEALEYTAFVGDDWDKVGDYVFNYTGVLAPGNSTRFNIIFIALEGGNWTNVVVAGSNLTEDKTAENSTFVHGPGIEVEKLTLNTTVILGNYVYFMIVVNNTGDCALHDVTVSEIFDLDELDYVNHTDSSAWIKSGNVFSYNGVLDVNGSANFTVWFTTKVNGTIVNTVNATSKETQNVTTHNDTLVISPNMTVTKLALNKTVVIGDDVYFMVVVNNTGDCALGNVTVSEIYDSSKLSLVDFDDHDLWELKGDVFTYKGVLDVNKSANFTVWFTANVNGTLVNTVNASSNLTENRTASNETKVINPAMTVEKLTVNKTVIVGDKVIFTIVVTNTGDTVLGNISVKENIPEGLSYSTFDGPGWEKVGDYVFNYTDVLAPGVSASFNITLNADEGGLWENSVVASSNMTDNKTAENTTFVHGPGIEVEKYALNATVVMGDYVYFMIVVNNTGDYPLHDVRVTEIFDSDELAYVNHTDSSVWIKSGNVFSYNGVLGVDENASFTIWFTTKVNGTIVNTVNATSKETKNVTTHNETLVINPNMTVQKLSLNRTVYIDEKVIFTIVVTNTGDCDLGDISVKEVIPDGLTYDAISGDDWVEVDDYVFNYTATLAPGNSTSFNITFIAHEGGNWTNTVIAKSNKTDDVVANNTTYVMGPGLDVDKVSLNATAVVIGDYAYFMITVENTGDCDLGDVTVEEFFNSNELEYVNHTDNAVWVKEGNVFKYQGILSEGASSNFTVWFRTLTSGTLVNNVTVKSNVTENLNSSANVTVISPNMTVEKLALNTTVVVGNDVYFMIVVRNTGDCDLADVAVSEIYDSDKLTLVDFDNKDLWKLTGDVFTYNGVLAAGESANFTVWFTTKVNGTIANTVNASSNMTENKTATNETKVINPNMTVQKLTVNKTVIVGDKVIFTIVVTNTGDCDLGDISITENIPEGLSYSTFDGPGWEKVGDYVFNYTGVLAPGLSASFNITLNADEGGLWENSVVASSNLTDDKTAENTTFVHGPGIEVEKYALNATVVMGDYVYFMIVVNNTGDYPLHDVRVTEIFDSDELAYVNHTDSSVWTKTGDVFTYNGVLDVNGSVRFTIWFTTKVNGTIVNTVNATSKETKNVTTHNETLVVNPNMTVEKLTLNETVVIGDDVYFMIVVTNTGDCDLSDVVVTESYSSHELTLKDFSNKDLWTRSGDVFTYNGVLAAGESANFTVWFTTKVNGTVVNTVNASSNMTENKTSKNTTDVEKELCDLEISKLVSASEVYVNHFVEWTIIVANNGPFTAKDVIVNDTLPKGIEIISCSHTYEQKGNSLIWKLDDLKVNDTVEIMLFTRVLEEGKIDNFVCVNTTTDESDYDNNNATNTTFVNPICDLIINKTVNVSNVYVNDTVQWTISVINAGPSTAKNVNVKDTLPEGVEIIDFNASAGSFYPNTRIWEIGELEANKPVSLVLVTKILTEGTITNIVSVNTTTDESDETNNKANNSTVADPICDLVINKTVNASSVYVGDNVEWIITVVNAGPSQASDVKVKDTLPEGVEIISASADVGSFDKGTRIWEIGKLDANKPVSLVLVTKINAEGNITNIVIANTTTHESDKTNNEANNTTVANPICDLEIVKKVDSTVVYLNDSVIWTIEVINHGPSVAENVVVRDVLPEGISLVIAIPSTGSYSNGIWNIGELRVNTPVTLELITQAVKEGNIVNVASVNSTTPDSDESNNIANNTTEVLPVCDLEITKLVNASSVNITDLVEWTITVVNNGPSAASDVVVRDILPEGLKFISAKPSVGKFADGIWTVGDLDANTPVSLVIITQAVKEGDIVNVAIANSSTKDSNESNNKANNTTHVEPVCDLEIIKIASSKKAYVGEELTWTIIVTNHGPSTAYDVKVFEDIPSSLKLVKASASKGSYNKKTNIWTIGKLESGLSETLVITTKVLSVGNITNPVDVTSTTPDCDKSNNKANDTIEAKAIVDLEVSVKSDKSQYRVGDKIIWTITVKNHGPSDAHEVIAIDNLPSTVKFISYKSSKGDYDPQTGEWYIGDLANGESATMKIICIVLKVGKITNDAIVSCNETESNYENNHDKATVEVIENESQTPEKPHKIPSEPARMLETGNPIAYLLVTIAIVLGSIWIPRRKE